MGGETEETEFEWDAGNTEKNWLRHQVSQAECEQVFFNRPFVITEDDLHSHNEARFYALGQTDAGRLLRVIGHPAARGRDPIPAQDLLGLILMDLQDVLLSA